MSVRAYRHTECTCQPEVCQFDITSPINQQVLRLQIPVQHAVHVAVRYAFQKLIQVALRTQKSQL